MKKIAIALVSGLVVACGASVSTPPADPYAQIVPVAPAPLAPSDPSVPHQLPAPTPVAPRTTGASCAADASWVEQVGGKTRLATVMRFDEMRRRGPFGPEVPILTYNDFTNVRRTSEEKYEWTPANERRNRNVVVLRNASGTVPGGYGTPIRHPSGVLEHGPGPRSHPYVEFPFSLFVFPDGTWVRTEGPMTARMRELFAVPGKAPPLPALDRDVAWEICGAPDELDANELSLPWDLWTIEGQRTVVRLFGSRADGELGYSFLSPDLAARAANDQATRCANGACRWMTSVSVEGSFVRFGVTIKTPPTTGRTVLAIAEPTRPLASPPPENAPRTPGDPPSGVYQEFVDVKSDTCPTHAAGKKFPSMWTSILLTHRNGRAFTTLESSDPRAPGMMTGSQMKDVELRPGAVVKKSTTHLCPNYAIERTMTVLSVTGDTIRVRDEVRHVGSTAGCRHQSLPSNCSNENITTWKLARKACDARCDATLSGPEPQYVEGDPAPKLPVSCACP